MRKDPRANAAFMDVLTSPRDPETVLRWMNEASVFGRFIPDFGRVVAQMQFDMYHHYTVDEHTIRAVGLLAKIEKGDFKGQSAADKMVTVFNAFKGFKYKKLPESTVEEALKTTNNAKREAHGAI